MLGGYVAVFVGGGIGAALRHAVNRASLTFLGAGFPYGTLMVNIAGGLFMGVLAELFLLKGGGSQDFRLFLTTGILGGFTTFSAFSLETALMWERSEYGTLSLYVASSVLLSVAASFRRDGGRARRHIGPDARKSLHPSFSLITDVKGQ